MFRLASNGDLVFKAKDLKEVYEPIVRQFGFEYEEGLDKDKKGLVWSKLYVAESYNENLWPVMVIGESGASFIPSPENATYFSTSLWWEDFCNSGFMIGVNPDEFDDGSGDEVADFIDCIKSAQREVNEVLEKCRQQLVDKLTEVKKKLIAESGKEELTY